MRRLQEPEDAASEIALEAAQRFAAVLAFGALARDVGGGRGIQPRSRDGEAMQRAVELAVAAAIQAMAIGAPGGRGDRCHAACPGELGVAGEPADPRDLA